MGMLAKLWQSLTGNPDPEERARRILDQARVRSAEEMKSADGKKPRSGPIRRIFK